MKPSFAERMAVDKEAAAHARYKGRAVGGKIAKGHMFKRAEPERGSWEELVCRAKAGYADAVASARAEYDWQARLRWIVEEAGENAF